jgi:hypothetical protein
MGLWWCVKTNEQCKPQNLMIYDELRDRDMGHFVPMRKEVY